ncbi:hypothetical protein ACEW7V_01285 [Areca yellow leaf disease phytoplasma]|uniref:hypothetical protein n=1 Tax=Areca yellow leaf disease phytoplasma TaxID=927614 RepID=UPI0035B517B3
MKQANLGICVDSGAEITKEIADFSVFFVRKTTYRFRTRSCRRKKNYTNALNTLNLLYLLILLDSLSILLASLCLNFQPMIVLQVYFLEPYL